MIFVPGYVISTDDLPIPIYEGSKTVVYVTNQGATFYFTF